MTQGATIRPQGLSGAHDQRPADIDVLRDLFSHFLGRSGFANVIGWFLSGVTGVYLGIADRVREAAYEAIGSGSNSFHRRSILERLVRDVRPARHHPPSAPVAQQMIGIARRKLS